MPATALPAKLQAYVDDLGSLDKMTRTLLLLDYGDTLAPYPESAKTEVHLVPGCVSRVWLDADFDGTAMHYAAEADGQIAQGMVALLVNGLSGETPETILSVDPAFIRDAGLAESLTPARQGGLASLLQRMQQAARAHAD